VENAGAAGWMLSDDDWRRLDRLGWETSQRIIYVTWRATGKPPAAGGPEPHLRKFFGFLRDVYG